jgi:TldD protein
MKELLGTALTAARDLGATYADCRAENIEARRIEADDGTASTASHTESRGVAVRVIQSGAWGFAAVPEWTADGVARAAREAVAVARASARLAGPAVRLAAMPVAPGGNSDTTEYRTPMKIDPFAIPIPELVAILQGWHELAMRTAGITNTSGHMDFRREEKWFQSTDGPARHQIIVQTGSGFSCSVRKSRRESATRSYPSGPGQYATGGFEIVQSIPYEREIPRIAAQAVALLSAPEAPAGPADLVLSSDLVSLQIHESIGHPLELDRVYGSERNFSGTSFATTDKLNGLRYGSELITVHADATAPWGLGTFGFDDEGVPAQKYPLIEKGMLVGYLTSRETAARLGLPRSGGCARAEGWQNLPLVRMTNINLEPGSGSPADLIAGIDRGLYIEGTSSWSIDDRRENFQLAGEVGWVIEGGKIRHLVKGPRYRGNTVTFWNACDGIAGRDHYYIWGTPNCGKGQPGQNMRTGQGASHARFRQIEVGEES